MLLTYVLGTWGPSPASLHPSSLFASKELIHRIVRKINKAWITQKTSVLDAKKGCGGKKGRHTYREEGAGANG